MFANPEELAEAAAGEFYTRARRVLSEGRVFTCALSGGSTPLGMYRRMTRGNFLASLPAAFWHSVHFFWGDERDVPPDHPDSNYHLAWEALLNKIAIPGENIHRIRTGSGPAPVAASAYETELREFFGMRPGEIPRFDLVFLGMGEEGHVASLFPHSEALREKSRLVAAPWVARFNSFRITLTLPVLNNAACVIFLVQGIGKAETLRCVLTEPPRPDLLPAQAIHPEAGELVWLVDKAAAAKMEPIPNSITTEPDGSRTSSIT